MTLGLLGAAIGNVAILEAPPPPASSLVRDITGLIFHDSFNRANEQLDVSSFWLRTDGTGLDNLVSNEVAPQSPYGDAQTTGIPTIPTSSMHQINFIQGTGGNGFGSYWARNALVGSQNAEGVGVEWNTGIGSFVNFIEKGNVRSDFENVSSLGTVSQTARIVIEDLGASGIKARFYRTQIGARTDITSSLTQLGGELSTTLANSPVNSDIFRATHGATANFWDEVIIVGGFEIRIEGLPTGFKARAIGSDVTGSSATESGGVALVNVETINILMSGIEVLNASDELQASFFSGSAVHGGDVYTFTE